MALGREKKWVVWANWLDLSTGIAYYASADTFLRIATGMLKQPPHERLAYRTACRRFDPISVSWMPGVGQPVRQCAGASIQIRSSACFGT